jgi:hypothetical protein
VPDDTLFRVHSFDLSAIAGLEDNPDASFRIYGYNAESGLGTWRIDDVLIAGDPIGGNQPISVLCGGPAVVIQGRGGTHPVSARDPDGRVVDIAVTGVNPAPAPGTITMTNVIPAPGIGLTATGQVSITALVPAASYAVEITARNEDTPTQQTGSCNLTVNVLSRLFIGQVQGVISDTLPNPFTHASPYNGQTVVVEGIVTDKMITRSSGGAVYYNFYLQERPQDSDGDTRTSDGVHVFIGTSPLPAATPPRWATHTGIRGRSASISTTPS